MSLFRDVVDSFFSGSGFMGGGMNTYYGTLDSYEEQVGKAIEAEPSNMSTVFMAAKILSGAISMMPLSTAKEGKEDKSHKLYYKLRHRMNEFQNNQVIISTVEYQRNIYGNSFIDIRKGKFELIPIETVEDYRYKSGKLEYKLNWACEYDYINKSLNKDKGEEWIASKDVLHFRGLSGDGVFAMPTITAIFHNLSISNKATGTIEALFKNKAYSNMSVESTLPDSASSGKLMIEQVEKFKNKYVGVSNNGKPIFLPPNTKLNPLQMSMVDSELISVLKFTRDEIANVFQIPNYLHSSTDVAQLDIESMTSSFRQFTILPIVKMYEEEFKYKLFSEEEVVEGWGAKFDTDTLVAADLVNQANAYAKFLQSGVLSPYEASKRMGFTPSEHPDAKKHYQQAQLLPIGENMAGVEPTFKKSSEKDNKTVD